jgi:NADH-quinone oxidoreductase subunit N
VNFPIPTFDLGFYYAAMPVLVLCVGAITGMMQSVFPKIGGPKATLSVLLISLTGALVSAAWCKPDAGTDYLFGTLLTDSLSSFGQIVILGISLMLALMFKDSYLKEKFFRGEVTFLYMLSVAGMLVMVASDDMITMFVGLELSSIGLYALVGYIDPSRRSQEGAVKYFILGAFSAGLLLFGFGLLYAGTGSMRFSEIVTALPNLADQNWIRLGALFTAIGLCFKLALAPFHLWSPDAYEAAPTGITALMATAVKVMILIVMCRLFAGGYSHLYDVWTPAIMFVAVLSMIFGNILALVQNNLKRMLAYSSIAHSGYMAVAICAIGGDAGFSISSVMFYIIGYSISSIGAFGILMWLESEKNDNLLLDDLNGMNKKHPWASFAMATFMFAFAGMPPTVGFIAKFFVFNAAIKGELYSLVIIGVIGSTISLYYYLRVIVRMYMTEADGSVTELIKPKFAKITTGFIALALISTLLLGTVLPGKAMKLVKRTVSDLTQVH